MKYLRVNIFLTLLIVLLVAIFILSVGMGAMEISPVETLAILAHQLGFNFASFDAQQESVLLYIRLPRVISAILIGASLAVSGAAMQGLFRNPLADPGLIGISSGASLAAVFTIVAGSRLLPDFTSIASLYSLSLATFIGACITMVVVYKLSNINGRVVISTMLLSGIAINAFAGALTGFFTFNANDAQLRSITFWTLGSLGGATWTNVMALLPFTLIPVLVLPRLSKSLNALALGENTAMYLGINIDQAKKIIVVLTALCVGASVAVAGIIGFVGLVIPHIVRKAIGPDHRFLLPLSALSGAVLLMSADLVCRTAFAPAEVPIGIITAMVGAPLFLYILIKDRKSTRLA